MKIIKDQKSKYCQDIWRFIEKVVYYRNALSCDLPDNFDDYWKDILGKNSRTEYRKATKNGLKVERIDNLAKYHKQIIDVFYSAEERGGRKLNPIYQDLDLDPIPVIDKYPNEDFTKYTCPRHRYEFWVVKKDKCIVAFAEVIYCGDVLYVHSTMGHPDFLKSGSMKLLFIEIAKMAIEKNIKYFIYGTSDFLRDNRGFFARDLGFTTILNKTYLPDYNPDAVKKTFVLDFDDLEIGKPGLDLIFKLKEHYPKLKISLFFVPLAEMVLSRQITTKEYRAWIDELKKLDWVELLPHGVTHQQGEMMVRTTQKGKEVPLDYKNANLYLDVVEHTYKDLGLPLKKIWKSPHWLSSPATCKALWDRGYTIAVDPNQPMPVGGNVYVYNWSVEFKYQSKYWDYDVVKGHGHMYGKINNAIHKCLNNLLSIPPDAEFKFVSEVVDEKQKV